ncbi:MAG: hypothetical protein IPM34_01435 [Saprospiraceae bacterium]|nr:hypothetical protein [Saprospiraceae bacterium]
MLALIKIKNVLGIICLLSLCSCSLKEPSWDTEIVTPLLKTRLNINQLSNENDFSKDSAGVLQLVYRTHLYDLAIDSFFEFSDTSLKNTFRIDSLSLYNSRFDYPLSLGTLARNAGPVGQLLLLFHGFTQIIPEIQPISGAPIDISADTIFQTMTLESGTMDLSLQNGLPIDITNVEYLLKNARNNEVIVAGNFPLIPAGGLVTRSIDLSGKTIEGMLTAQLVSLSSPGSKGVPVLIDTSNQVLARIQVSNLHPLTATALWPAQNLINDSYYFGLEGLPVELKESFIGSGLARIRLSSTLQDSVRFSYSLPTATKNGVPFHKDVILSPATPGGVSQRVEEESLKGYHFDFSGENSDSFNLQFNRVVASIDSTGEIKTISKTDSIFVELAFENLHPDYAKGYLNDTVLGTGETYSGLDFFSNIREGKFEVEKAKLQVEVTNKIGVDLNMIVHKLEGINKKTATLVPLNAEPLMNPVFIPRATDQGGKPPIRESVVLIDINETNSGIREFIANLPEEIVYDIDLMANPQGNVSNWNDFIYDGELMNLDLLLEIPLSVSAEGLVLADTSLIEISGNDYARIKEGVLHAFFKNDFPVDCNIQIYVLNEENDLIDSLFANGVTIDAAIAGPGGKTQGSKETRKDIPMDYDRIQNILNFKKVYIVARFDTKPGNSFQKIYEDYSLEFILTADFTYEAGK